MVEIALTVCVFVATLCLCFSCLTYAFFWYETANSDYRVRLDRLSGNRTGRWIFRGILTSWATMILTVVLYPLGIPRSLLRPSSALDPSSPPILLVHGLYHNATGWMLFRKWLKRAGFTNVYAINYNTLTRTFRESVDQLNRSIEGIARLHPGQGVILIGHSLGGLLSRICAERASPEGAIAAVITLGTPHHGSRLAVLGPGRTAPSLIPGGPLFEELERDSKPGAVPCLALYSPMDNMVLPNDALVIERQGWTVERIAPISHVAMLFHRATAMRTIEWMKALPQSQ